MNIIIETEDMRRPVEGVFKLYGSDADLKAIRDSIQRDLDKGLVQGWVGVETSKEDRSVFPFNGREGVLTKNWKE